jgi:hypothetical protein
VCVRNTRFRIVKPAFSALGDESPHYGINRYIKSLSALRLGISDLTVSAVLGYIVFNYLGDAQMQSIG